MDEGDGDGGRGWRGAVKKIRGLLQLTLVFLFPISPTIPSLMNNIASTKETLLCLLDNLVPREPK